MVFTNHIPDNGLISEINKEHLTLYQETKNPIKNCQVICIHSLPMKING